MESFRRCVTNAPTQVRRVTRTRAQIEVVSHAHAYTASSRHTFIHRSRDARTRLHSEIALYVRVHTSKSYLTHTSIQRSTSHVRVYTTKSRLTYACYMVHQSRVSRTRLYSLVASHVRVYTTKSRLTYACYTSKSCLTYACYTTKSCLTYASTHLKQCPRTRIHRETTLSIRTKKNSEISTHEEGGVPEATNKKHQRRIFCYEVGRSKSVISHSSPPYPYPLSS